jgi:ribosomal protein L37AE/L43A
MKIDYQCTYCDSSENVVWDAYAIWDVEKQEMQLESSYDQCECNVCGSTDIEKIEHKEEVTS